MKNFLLTNRGVDTIPLLLALRRQPELWNQNTLRTTHPGTPHTEVDDIWLRFNALPPLGQEALLLDEHESIDYPAYKLLPEARALVMSLMAYVQGERLGRVLITRLRPGGHIAAHEDGGSHAAYYDRFHVVLQARSGSEFRCGNELVHMQPGDVWWFQNAIEHEVWNRDRDVDRIHLIVDIRTSR